MEPHFQRFLADEDYTPSTSVQSAHNFPHIAASWPIQSTSNEFDPANMDYLMSIAVLPAIILVLGLLSLLYYHFFLCCCCCTCCKCVDKVGEEETEITEKRLKKIVCRRRAAIVTYIVLILCIIVANNVMWFYGNDKVSDGVETTMDAFNYMENYTNFMIYYANNITAYGDDIDTSVDAAVSGGCTDANQLYSMVNSMQSGTQSFVDILNPIPGAINDMTGTIDDYGNGVRNNYMWYAYLFLWLIPAFYIIGYFLRFKWYLQGVIIISGILVLVLTFVCCIWMVLVTLFGDYCMAPTDNALKYLEDMSFYDTVNYFFTCSGTNPLASPSDTIDDAADQIIDALNFLVYNSSAPAACQNNPDLINAIGSIDDVFDEVGNILGQLTCTPIQATWEQLVHVGFCTHAYDGMFGVWAGLFACSWCLFLLNFVSGVLLQYFDVTMWNIGDPKFTLLPFDDTHEVLYENTGDGDGGVEMSPAASAPPHPGFEGEEEEGVYEGGEVHVGLELAPLQRPKDDVAGLGNEDVGPAMPVSPPAVNRSKWSLV